MSRRARQASIGAAAAAAAVVAAMVGGTSTAVGATGRSAAKAVAAQQLTTLPGLVQQDGATLSADVSAEVKAVEKAAAGKGVAHVVIRLRTVPVASYRGGLPGYPATSPKTTGRALSMRSPASRRYRAHVDSQISSFVARARAKSPGLKVTGRLDVVVGGVAMTVPTSALRRIAADPAVAGVYPDRLEQPQTDVTPQFIGAPAAWARAGGQESAGENAVIGVLDTGIWPEHPSLSDPDPSGKPYPAPAGGLRTCDFGSAVPGDAPFTCNNKLIGAYRFMGTYDAAVGIGAQEFPSARDDDGHGTHTSTTAAGNAGVAASIFGTPRGIISGIAPRAHVIMYKVCGADGCFSSDSALAVQQAILDHVDAINFSIGGGANPYTDAVSLAFLDAYNAGIFVAASAGNSGPGPDTTDHREPWVTTVAASTGPRSFQGGTTLTSSDGATLTLAGTSVTQSAAAAPLVIPTGDPICASPFAAGSVTGKIVLCMRGGGPGRVQKGFDVLQGGAAGMVLYNNATNVTDLETDNHFLPAVQVQYADGQAILAFVAAHPDVTASIQGGVKAPQQGDVMASFSSRGGPGQSLGISKPDVTAPGVQVLAGASPLHADLAAGPQGELFQAIAGTSMSSPHVAGAGALLASLHPDWTPGQIHSALMTTANTHTVKEDGTTPTDAFDDGSGRIDLSGASHPWFTIDETGANYLALKSALYKANYPSLYVPALAGSLTVTRTLQSVSKRDRDYRVSVSAPRDLDVRVSPSSFTLRKGRARTISISVDGRDVPLGETRFATIRFRADGRTFTFPVTIVRGQAPVAITKSCAPDPIAVGAQATCTVTMTNATRDAASVSLVDRVPSRLRLVPGSVTGGTASGSTVRATTTIPAQQAPDISAAYAANSSPAGYLSIDNPAFGSVTVSAGDETITNFNVPPFTVSGVTYSRIGIVSDGYVVLGGGTAADVDFVNQSLPNAARPNNVLAPFWTDLNPAFGGKVLVNVLTDGANTWIVVDWAGVVNYSDRRPNSFEVWIGVDGDAHPGQDVTMTYGAVTNGEGGAYTTGVENPDGTRGMNLFYNGAGQAPQAGDEVLVSGAPGQTFSSTVTYAVKGRSKGAYVNYAELTGPFDGTAVARFAGTVTR